MPVHRVVLFKLKPGTPEEKVQKFIEDSHEMRKILPGLISMEFGPAVYDLSRTKGFNFGIVLAFEAQEYLDAFAKHPAHMRLHNIREEMCEDSLAFVFNY